MDRASNIPPVCLTIAGLDPSGGAGIIADIRTFTRFGCFATAAVSSVTFQNTQGVFGSVHQTADSVRRQVEPIIEDYEVAAVKTGMLPTREIIEETARLIEANGLSNLVVDPVVRATSGFDLIDDAALRAVIERLFPLAMVVTPNIPEAERIAQMRIESEQDIRSAAGIIQSAGVRNVLIKGGHLNAARAKDFLFQGNSVEIFESEFIVTTSTHGTGCTLAAAIAANLAIGKGLAESIRIAKAFVHEAIRTAPGLGHGNSPINI